MTNITKIAGYPIVDADEPLELEVKGLDVKRGEIQTASCCALARACCRTLDIVEARVHLSRTYLRTRDGEWLRFITPAAARDEIIAFDRGGTFEPGTFIFRAPPKGNRIGDRANYKPTEKHNRSKRKRTRPYHVRNVRSWAGSREDAP